MPTDIENPLEDAIESNPSITKVVEYLKEQRFQEAVDFTKEVFQKRRLDETHLAYVAASRLVKMGQLGLAKDLIDQTLGSLKPSEYIHMGAADFVNLRILEADIEFRTTGDYQKVNDILTTAEGAWKYQSANGEPIEELPDSLKSKIDMEYATYQADPLERERVYIDVIKRGYEDPASKYYYIYASNKLGDLMGRMGRNEEAIRVWNHLMETFPDRDHSINQYKMAKAYENMGDSKSALKLLESINMESEFLTKGKINYVDLINTLKEAIYQRAIPVEGLLDGNYVGRELGLKVDISKEVLKFIPDKGNSNGGKRRGGPSVDRSFPPELSPERRVLFFSRFVDEKGVQRGLFPKDKVVTLFVPRSFGLDEIDDERKVEAMIERSEEGGSLSGYVGYAVEGLPITFFENLSSQKGNALYVVADGTLLNLDGIHKSELSAAREEDAHLVVKINHSKNFYQNVRELYELVSENGIEGMKIYNDRHSRRTFRREELNGIRANVEKATYQGEQLVAKQPTLITIKNDPENTQTAKKESQTEQPGGMGDE